MKSLPGMPGLKFIGVLCKSILLRTNIGAISPVKFVIATMVSGWKWSYPISKLAYNLFRGLTTYLYRGYNPSGCFQKYGYRKMDGL